MVRHAAGSQIATISRVVAGLDYVAHLGRESARFAQAIAIAPPGAPVPPCPEWTADDLLWHLAWVQWWWATIVRDGLTGPEARRLVPERPSSRPGLLEFYQRASLELQQILGAASPDAPAWTWSDDHTVGFIRRKQAHEALIHRIDAEVTAGNRTPMDPRLSADGVDEVLRVMYSGVPEWGSFAGDESKALRLQATDTGDSWLITLGRFTGRIRRAPLTTSRTSAWPMAVPRRPHRRTSAAPRPISTAGSGTARQSERSIRQATAMCYRSSRRRSRRASTDQGARNRPNHAG